MVNYNINDLPKNIQCSGVFGDNCIVSLSEGSISHIQDGRLEVRIAQIGPIKIENFNLVVSAVFGQILVNIGGCDSFVEFGEGVIGNYNLIVWRRSNIFIGGQTTANGVRIFADNSDIHFERDCMLSDSILVQGADQHGIIDIQSRKIVNQNRRNIYIGKHVWLGRNSIIMPDVEIGDGSIIGAGSIVTKDIPQCCIAAGVPAKIVRESTTWCRNPESIDGDANEIIDEYLSFQRQIAADSEDGAAG